MHEGVPDCDLYFFLNCVVTGGALSWQHPCAPSLCSVRAMSDLHFINPTDARFRLQRMYYCAIIVLHMRE